MFFYLSKFFSKTVGSRHGLFLSAGKSIKFMNQVKASCESITIKPRKLRFSIPLALGLVYLWYYGMRHILLNGAEIAVFVVLGSATLALLAFSAGHFQRVRVWRDSAQDELVWEVDWVIGRHERRFDIAEILEFGIHPVRAHRRYVYLPAIFFKQPGQAPFPLLTISARNGRATEINQQLNQWLGLEPMDDDIEIPEDWI